jgi:predicted DNA-binding transcriptional regulator AlpA
VVSLGRPCEKVFTARLWLRFAALAGGGAGGVRYVVLCLAVWPGVVFWDTTPRHRGHSVHYTEVLTMKLIRLITWAALAITSLSLGIAISGRSGNTTEAALVFAIATIALGRTANISFQSARPKLIDKGEIARFFGVSKRTVDAWVADGKLPKPRRRFGLRRWEYEKIRALRK